MHGPHVRAVGRMHACLVVSVCACVLGGVGMCLAVVMEAWHTMRESTVAWVATTWSSCDNDDGWAAIERVYTLRYTRLQVSLHE